MFWSIFKYEVKHWLRQPATYLYYIVFAAIAWFLFVGSAGYFDGPSTASGPQKLLNSPLGIHSFFQYFGKFILFLLPAILGQGLYRDFSSNTYQLMYSYPISKPAYWWAKLSSGLVVVLLISTALGVGLLLGEYTPGLDRARMGPFQAMAYLRAYLVHLWPNLLSYGLLVFLIVALSRNIYAGFLSILGLYILQLISQNAFANQAYYIGLFDPYGQNTVAYLTRFWTLEEQNTKHFPIQGILLNNRLLFFGASLCLMIWAYRKFQLHTQSPLFRTKRLHLSFGKKANPKRINTAFTPQVSISFSSWQNLIRSWQLGVFHLGTILSSWIFQSLVGLGLLAMVFALGRVTNTGEMTVLPLTRIMLTVPATFFNLIIMILTFIYTGMLVHKDRSNQMDQLVDSTAVPNSVLFGAPFFAILQMQIILLFTMMIAGVSLQIYNGYYHFEWGLYFYHLFGIYLISLVIWALLSFFIHNILPNPYLGIFLLFLMWIGFANLPQLGIDTKVLAFNSPETLRYSDINGFGHGHRSYWRLEWYWLTLALLLALFSNLLWRRGVVNRLVERAKQIRVRWNRMTSVLVLALTLLVIGQGFSLLTEEAKAISRDIENQLFKDFEQAFAKYSGTQQAQIKAIDLHIDLFPEENNFRANGSYLLHNESDQYIDTILVKAGFGERSTFDFDRAFQMIDQDTFVQFFVFQLDHKLAPGDSLQMNFSIRNQANTLFERRSNILKNGTFLQSDIFPRLGYFLEEYTLAPTDTSAHQTNMQYPFADRIDFSATVSTSADQIAIAPGYLQKQWEIDGRNYFQYKMDHPIKFLFSINSGRFKVKEESYKGTNLKVFYHPQHSYNLEKMMGGLKGALDYNSEFFSPYQHREARIIAFPEPEGTFATTSANSIPTSEIRFIANTDIEDEQIDIAFYVSAHELTHQWWGNQVLPADAHGSAFLVESITEYISLKVYERQYGFEKAMQFLRAQHGRYLRGRNRERDQEYPLLNLRQQQQYLSYGKGAMVLWSLSQQMGEADFNAVLKTFLEKYQFKAAPYPTSVDFLQHLLSAAPERMHQIIKDQITDVQIFNNRIVEAKPTKLSTKQYQVQIECTLEKFRSSLENRLPFDQAIEIGFYDQQNQLQSIQRWKPDLEQKSKTFSLDFQASRVVIDPRMLLIDLDLDDNEISLAWRD